MILQKWKPFFAWLPVETLIYEQQEGYYEALNASNTKGDSTIFVTFMLQIIRDALAEIIETQDSHHNVGVNVGTNEEKVFDTVNDCRKFFNEKNHRFITTRVTGLTKSLYKNEWKIAYTEDEYREFSIGVHRERTRWEYLV